MADETRAALAAANERLREADERLREAEAVAGAKVATMTELRATVQAIMDEAVPQLHTAFDGLKTIKSYTLTEVTEPKKPPPPLGMAVYCAVWILLEAPDAARVCRPRRVG
jgi:altronate dehydratase